MKQKTNWREYQKELLRELENAKKESPTYKAQTIARENAKKELISNKALSAEFREFHTEELRAKKEELKKAQGRRKKKKGFKKVDFRNYESECTNGSLHYFNLSGEKLRVLNAQLWDRIQYNDFTGEDVLMLSCKISITTIYKVMLRDLENKSERKRTKFYQGLIADIKEWRRFNFRFNAETTKNHATLGDGVAVAMSVATRIYECLDSIQEHGWHATVTCKKQSKKVLYHWYDVEHLLKDVETTNSKEAHLAVYAELRKNDTLQSSYKKSKYEYISEIVYINESGEELIKNPTQFNVFFRVPLYKENVHATMYTNAIISSKESKTLYTPEEFKLYATSVLRDALSFTQFRTWELWNENHFRTNEQIAKLEGIKHASSVSRHWGVIWKKVKLLFENDFDLLLPENIEERVKC